MNTVKVKHLLNTNHFEIPRHYITLIQLATVRVKFLNIFDRPLEFMLTRFHCIISRLCDKYSRTSDNGHYE